MPTEKNNSTPPKLKSLSPAIHRLLGSLRSRIRWHVFWEGLAIAVAWLVLTFWVAFAIDYGPVMFGFSELSRNVRLGILIFVSLLIAFILYRFVIRRVFVRMKNYSLAMLVERRHPQFNDSLLTTVSRTVRQASDVPVDASMQERTKRDAEQIVPDVDLATVVNSKPLKQSFLFAGLLLLSVVGFAIAQPAAMKIAGQRLYLLEGTAWPRSCQIQILGIKVKRENAIEGIEELGQVLKPTDGEFRIAKGSTLTLMIQAEGADEESSRSLPSNCSMIYRTADGDRGTQVFKKIGAPRDGFQLYSLDSQPLRGVLDDITFDVRGGDHRLGPFKISVVDEPNVLDTKLACNFPDYIVDETSLRWTDRTVEWAGQARLPQGTKIKIQSNSNKPLKKVYALDRANETMTSIEASGSNFEFEFPALDDRIDVQFFLCDTDGIVSEQPHVISIEPIEDQSPIVRTRLEGIGTAVTPDVQIPLLGSVQDDYGLQKTWVEIEVAETELLIEPIEINSDGDLDSMIDFKQRRQEKGEKYELPVGNESTVSLVIKSEDKFNLKESANMGIGDRYVLDIVSPNDLVRILERLEVGQRRRLEQIYLEIADARNYLMRSKSSRDSASDGLIEPGDSQGDVEEPGEEKDDTGIRKQELRLLFAQRAILQVDKSTQEILGCAEAFDNIRLQIINNRIDSEDGKKRLSEQIIGPLRLIGDQSMQQLRDKAVELELGLRDLQISPSDEEVSFSADKLAVSAIEQTDIILNQLDEVLNALIKYETQNELLEIVRAMIKQQQELMERTKKERQRKAFEGLLD